MKKFLIGTSAILFAIVAIIVSLACVKRTYDFDYSNASNISVFDPNNYDGTGKEHDGVKDFVPESDVYKTIINLLNKSMTNSVLTLLAHGVNINPVVEQDLSGEAQAYSSTTKESNYCIEIKLSKSISNQIVYYKGNTRYAESYNGLVFVLGPKKQFGQIYVYLKNSGGYTKNPIKLQIDNSKLVDYIDKM